MFSAEKTFSTYCKTISQLYLGRTQACVSSNRCIRYLSTAQHKSHYDVLQVDKNATTQHIKSQFIKLSKEHHPDLNTNNPNSHETFVAINEAYNVLSRQPSRQLYDARLRSMQNPSVAYNRGTRTVDKESVEYDDPRLYPDWFRKTGHHSNYYSVRGIKKMSNVGMVWFCCMLLTVGSLLHSFAMMYSNRFSRAKLDERDRRNNSILLNARLNARLYSTEAQLARAERAAHENKILRNKGNSVE